MDIEVNGEYQLFYKFDSKPSDDESLIIIYPEEFEIDVTEHILEFISVSVPSSPTFMMKVNAMKNHAILE